jgi:hypothetical protein
MNDTVKKMIAEHELTQRRLANFQSEERKIQGLSTEELEKIVQEES